MESEKVVRGKAPMTPYEMFEKLSPENQQEVIRQIETLIASQSSNQSKPDSQH